MDRDASQQLNKEEIQMIVELKELPVGTKLVYEGGGDCLVGVVTMVIKQTGAFICAVVDWGDEIVDFIPLEDIRELSSDPENTFIHVW